MQAILEKKKAREAAAGEAAAPAAAEEAAPAAAEEAVPAAAEQAAQEFIPLETITELIPATLTREEKRAAFLQTKEMLLSKGIPEDTLELCMSAGELQATASEFMLRYPNQFTPAALKQDADSGVSC